MNYKKLLLIGGVFLFGLGLYLPSFFGGFISGRIEGSSGNIEKSDYRFFWSNDPDLKYTYVLNVPIKKTTDRSFQVFPNDCIESLTINGVRYDGFEGDLCNTWAGVKLKDISKYLKIGDNEFTFKVAQNGGSRAFFLKPSIDDPIRIVSFSLIGLGFFLLLLLACIKSFVFDNNKKRNIFLLIFSTMYVLAWIFIIRSEYFQRSFDQTGHLDYFKLLLRGDWNPLSDMCWQCYHPNTYYWFHYYVYKVGILFQRSDPFDLIRVFTFLVRRVGIVFAYKVLYIFFYSRQSSFQLFLLSLLLFSFWPLQFYFGGRISNEVWNHALSYITIYYSYLAFIAFQDRDEKKLLNNTFTASVLVAAGLLIKSNSFIRFPLAGIGLFSYFTSFGLTGFFKKLFDLRLYILKIIIICAIFISGAFYISHLKGVKALIDNMDRINPGNSVAHVPLVKAFTSFSVHQYIFSKDMWSSKDNIETSSFRGFLSKSMILGEFVPMNAKNNPIVVYLMTSAFVVLCFFVLSLFIVGYKNWFLLVGSLVPIIAMMANRMINQYGSAMHYRLILPHLLFVSLIIVFGISKLKNKYNNILYIFAITLIVAFVILSFYYSIPPYF